MTGVRQAARLTAIGGGAAAAAAAGAAGVIGFEILAARRSIGPRRTVPPYADGRYGGSHGTSLRLAVLGDSLAAGLGATYAFQTPGVMLAEVLAARAGRPVVLSTIAEVGARSDHLAAQVQRALVIRPHVVVMVIGANDVTHLLPMRRQVALQRRAILDLREGGSQVVLATCPNLGTVRVVGPPARQFARHQSRKMAARQMAAALQVGAHTVSLGDTLGPEFEARPADLFGADRFHPSPEGYAALAEVLTPAVLSAAGFGLAGLPARYEPPRDERIVEAVEQAVAQPGTVLSPVRPPQGERRRLARMLLHRGE
jgi:lysophospholipase L1-like esterase